MATGLIEIDRARGLETVSRRNKFIEGLRKTREIYRKRRQFPAFVVKTLTRLAIPKTKLEGKENLNIASQKIAKGEQVTGVANHTANLNHPILENALESKGYEDLASRLVFPSGLKMWEMPETKPFMWAMNTIPIAAPGYFEDARRLSQSDLSEKDQAMMKTYLTNLSWLNKAALRELLPGWRKGNLVPIVYPETTRSRDGYIQRGRVETDIYFQRGWIIPFLIEGNDDVFSPEGEGKPDLKKLIMRQLRPCVTAGQLISGEVLHAPTTLDWLRDRNANPVDFIMSRIANLNPKLANPELRPLYDSLNDDIPDGLVLKAA